MLLFHQIVSCGACCSSPSWCIGHPSLGVLLEYYLRELNLEYHKFLNFLRVAGWPLLVALISNCFGTCRPIAWYTIVTSTPSPPHENNAKSTDNNGNTPPGRFRTARAQRGHSANYYGDYPGNNPENHPPAESCTINSKLKNSNI